MSDIKQFIAIFPGHVIFARPGGGGVKKAKRKKKTGRFADFIK